MKLDKMHHIAIQVSDIKKSVDWYKSKFACKVDYCDSSWALLKFANISMAGWNTLFSSGLACFALLAYRKTE